MLIKQISHSSLDKTLRRFKVVHFMLHARQHVWALRHKKHKKGLESLPRIVNLMAHNSLWYSQIAVHRIRVTPFQDVGDDTRNWATAWCTTATTKKVEQRL